MAGSKKATVAFNQEQTISSRKMLEEKMASIDDEHLECPQGSGGYLVMPAIAAVLDEYNLAGIPEGHIYLNKREQRFDITFPD